MKTKTLRMSRNNDQQQRQHGRSSSSKMNFYDAADSNEYVDYNEHGDLMPWNDDDEYHQHQMQLHNQHQTTLYGVAANSSSNIDVADDDEDHISQMSSVSQRGWMDLVVQQSYDKALQIATPILPPGGLLQQHQQYQHRRNVMGGGGGTPATSMMPMPMTMMMGSNTGGGNNSGSMSQMGNVSGTTENSVVSHTDDDANVNIELSIRRKEIMLRKQQLQQQQQQLLMFQQQQQAQGRGMSTYGNGPRRGTWKSGKIIPNTHPLDTEGGKDVVGSNQNQNKGVVSQDNSNNNKAMEESMTDVSALSPTALEDFSEDEIDNNLDEMLSHTMPTVLQQQQQQQQHHPGDASVGSQQQQQLMQQQQQQLQQRSSKANFRRHSLESNNSIQLRNNMRFRGVGGGGVLPGASDPGLRKRMNNMMMMPPVSYDNENWNDTIESTSLPNLSGGGSSTFASTTSSTTETGEGLQQNSSSVQTAASAPMTAGGDDQIRWLKQYMKKLENDYRREQQKLHQLLMSTSVDLREELLMGDDDDVANFDDLYPNAEATMDDGHQNDDIDFAHSSSSTTSRVPGSSSAAAASAATGRNVGSKGWQQTQRSNNKSSIPYPGGIQGRMMSGTPSPSQLTAQQHQFQMGGGNMGQPYSRSKFMSAGGSMMMPEHLLDMNTAPLQSNIPGRRSSVVSVSSANQTIPTPGFGLMSRTKRPALSSIIEQQQAALSSMLSSSTSSFAYNPTAAAFAAESHRVLQQQAQEPKPKKPRQKKCKPFPVKFMEAVKAIGDTREDIVGWLPDGKSLVIVDPELFLQVVIQPPYFANSTAASTATAPVSVSTSGSTNKESVKYESFVRKLNRWGFTRLASGTGLDCFYHPYFNRDQPELAAKIEQLHHILAAETEAANKQQDTSSTTTPLDNNNNNNPYDLNTSMASAVSSTSVHSSGQLQDNNNNTTTSSSSNTTGFYGSRFNDLLSSKDPPSLSGLNHFVERRKQRLTSSTATDVQSTTVLPADDTATAGTQSATKLKNEQDI